LDFAKLGEALGLPPENIAVASPRDLATLEAILRRLDNQPGPILLIAREPCVLHRRASWMGSAWEVDPELCISCGSCLDLGCPAITRQDDAAHGSDVVAIDAYLCVGCGLCGQVCPVGAIAVAGLSQPAPSALEGSNA
jgi:indolepyruvate ferredoxin oxidoreductase alpha subunit